jgi:DNA-binding NarL/FixJ family response regulator
MDTLSVEDVRCKDRAIQPDKLTVAIIERRVFLRDCITRALVSTAGLDVVAAESLEDWLEMSDTRGAALVVLSTGGGKDGETAEQIAALAQSAKPLPTVILSDDENVERIVDALKQGARGYICTNMPLAVIVEAFRLINAGGTFAPAGSLVASRKLIEDSASSQQSQSTAMFTARQAAVIEAVRQGKSNKIIAYELNMCESTVKVHVRNIMKRLNAKNRTHVAFLANELLQKSEY